jgi:hypothetical protein
LTSRARGGVGLLVVLAAAFAACASEPAPSEPAFPRVTANATALGFGCEASKAVFGNRFKFVTCRIQDPDGRLRQQVAVYGRPDGTLAGIESIIGLQSVADVRASTLADFDGLLQGVVDGATVAKVHNAIVAAGPAQTQTELDGGATLVTQIGADSGRVTMLASDLAVVWGHPTAPQPSA